MSFCKALKMKSEKGEIKAVEKPWKETFAKRSFSKSALICSRSRKAKILTTGIHGVFRGLKSESDAEIGQKGTFCKGLEKKGENNGLCNNERTP